MHFRAWIIALSSFYQGREFTTKELVSWTSPPEGQVMVDASIQKMFRRLDGKRISITLTRLYRMGFLRRRLVNRTKILVRGRRRNLGKEYVYRVSRQGEQYVSYLLDRDKVRAEFKKKLIAREVISPDYQHFAIWAKSSEEIEIMNRLKFLRKKRYKRFHAKMTDELGWKYLVARKMLREKGVSDKEFFKNYAQARAALEPEGREDVIARVVELSSPTSEFSLSASEARELRNLLNLLLPASLAIWRKRMENIPVSPADGLVLVQQSASHDILSKWLKAGRNI